ncbi:MAG: hypothetical protein JSS51_01375 [Planctomycetes bacterium]|nr:hypothetical protein [Planctomycetota bacterium]
MPISAQQLVGRLKSKKVTLPSGIEINLRTLSSLEIDAIADLYPRPAPPLGKNPLAGTEAPPVPREDDVGYQKRLRRWYVDVRAAELAAAMDFEHPIDDTSESLTFASCPEARRSAWFASAVPALKSSLSEPELRLLTEEMHSLTTVPLVKEAIRILLVERDETRSADGEKEIQVPQNYDRSELGLLMSAAERFGQDPLPWINRLEPGERQLILAQELIRKTEEAEKLTVLAAAARIAAG